MIPKGDDMANMLKWTVIAGLASAVTGQHIGWTAPAIKEQAATQSVAEIIGSELDRCYSRVDDLTERLASCVERCQP